MFNPTAWNLEIIVLRGSNPAGRPLLDPEKLAANPSLLPNNTFQNGPPL